MWRLLLAESCEQRGKTKQIPDKGLYARNFNTALR